MNFRRWVVFSFLTHVLVVLMDKSAGFVLLLLLVDLPYIKGAADLLTTFPFILMAVANLGLASSTVYFLRRREFDLQEVSETSSFLALYWGLFVAALAFAVGEWVLPAIKPEWELRTGVLLPLVLCTPFLLISSYFNSIQLAEEKVRDYNLVHLTAAGSFLPLFFLCYWVTGHDVTAGIALGRLAGAILVAIVTLRMMRGVVTWRPRLHARFLKAGITYGWKANLTSVLSYLNHRIDLYLVGALFLMNEVWQAPDELRKLKLDQVAFYSLAVTVAELVWHFPEATRDLFFSKVASITEQHARAITPVLCRLALWVALVGSIGIYLLTDPLMTMIFAIRGSASWQTTWSVTVMPTLFILIFGTVGFTVAKVLQSDLAARGHQNACLVASSMALLVMVTLDWLWVPSYGAIGAAWASTIAYLASSAFTLVAYKWSGGSGMLDCLLPRRGDLSYFKDIVDGVRAKLPEASGVTAEVAVVVPAYQSAAFLADALRSAQGQSLPPAEIIVVDDGSSDGSGMIAEQLGVRCVRQENRGPGAARNRGVRETRAPLIAFLDADDRFLPDKLARQVHALVTSDAVASCGDAWILRDGERRGRKNVGRRVPSRLALADLVPGNPIVASTALVRRAALTRVGGFDEDRVLIATEDYDLWLRLAAHGGIDYLDEPLVDYRVHGQSLSDNERFQRGVDRIMDKLVAAHRDDERLVALAARRRGAVREDAAFDLVRQGRGRDARRLLREARAVGGWSKKAIRLWLRSWLPTPMAHRH